MYTSESVWNLWYELLHVKLHVVNILEIALNIHTKLYYDAFETFWRVMLTGCLLRFFSEQLAAASNILRNICIEAYKLLNSIRRVVNILLMLFSIILMYSKIG